MRRVIVIILAIGVLGLIGFMSYRAYKNGKASSQTVATTATGETITNGDTTLKADYIADPKTTKYNVGIYPNATADEDKTASSNFDYNGTKSVSGAFKTTDTFASVVNFYKKQMGLDAVVSTLTDTDVVYYVVSSKSLASTVVAVYTDGNVTRFVIYQH